MKSQLTKSFLTCFNSLPSEIQNLARKNFSIWKENARHPSLHFKEINKENSIWSARVGNNYRVLGILENDLITWFWIGTHAEYDKIIKDL